ncbi:MAG: hypothetical protein JJ891_16850 [Rhizobiaceae bacterium]|nr:hypothetical protein [Rhizobiaceae bacterium]
MTNKKQTEEAKADAKQKTEAASQTETKAARTSTASTSKPSGSSDAEKSATANQKVGAEGSQDTAEHGGKVDQERDLSDAQTASGGRAGSEDKQEDKGSGTEGKGSETPVAAVHKEDETEANPKSGDSPFAELEPAIGAHICSSVCAEVFSRFADKEVGSDFWPECGVKCDRDQLKSHLDELARFLRENPQEGAKTLFIHASLKGIHKEPRQPFSSQPVWVQMAYETFVTCLRRLDTMNAEKEAA